MLPHTPDDLHRQLATSDERLAAVLAAAVAPLTTQRVFVFLRTPGSNTGGRAPAQPRTIPAFVSPDDAVTFAQRNGASPKICVRGLSASDLLRNMLATPSIGTVLFLQPLSPDPTVKQFPPGIVVTRAALLAALQA